MYDENDYVGRNGAINVFIARLFFESWPMMLIRRLRRSA
jgi:hypothetical protein